MEKSCLSSGETGKQQDPLSEKEASLCSATISEKQNSSCGCLFSQRKEHYDFLQKNRIVCHQKPRWDESTKKQWRAIFVAG